VKLFEADLHIHTALSPCALEEMTPRSIVRQALYEHLDMIAICDHNTAGNAAAVKQAAGNALAVVAGIEITTAEEVHALGLFPDAESAECVGEIVRATLPDLSRRAKKFPEQVLLNAKDEVVGAETKMLGAASSLTLSDAVALIKRHGGLAIASHVDRPSFSVPSQLGLFPEGVAFDAIEISPIGLEEKRHRLFDRLGLPMLVSSDSHFLSDIGCGLSMLRMREPVFSELALALRGVGGRRCRIA